MLKRAAALIATASILIVADALAATYAVWQGTAVITATTSACSAGLNERTRIAPGATFLSVVRPRLLLSNGNNSRIAFNHDADGEFFLVLAGGLTIAGPGTYTAYGVTPSGLLKTNVGGNYQNFTLTPAAPTLTTTFLTLTGAIQNFMFIPGCTVTFRAGYSRRP
jgi:hypothetical protein